MPVIKELKQHKVVLDTHVLIWTMEGSSSLGASFKKSIARLEKQDEILISAISVWEIGMLAEKKRIQFEMDVLDWIEHALESPGIKLIPITPRIALQSSRLPGETHGDPADRIIIATAHENNAVLVTCDEKLLKYGQDKYISVFDPR